MRRFYLTIYLTVLGSLVLFGVLASLTFLALDDDEHESARKKRLQALGELIAQTVPARNAADLQSWLDKAAHDFEADLTIYSANGD